MRRRGQTLIEMLVVCGMVLGASLVIFALWEVGGRMFLRSDGQSVSQRAVLKFINQFSREEVVAASSSVTNVYRSPSQLDLALSFLSDQDSGGNTVTDPGSYGPIYQAWMVYYTDLPTATIRRIRAPLTTPTMSMSVLSGSDINTDISAGPSTVVLSNVVSWQALDYNTGTALTQNPARYTVQVNSLEFALEFRSHLLR